MPRSSSAPPARRLRRSHDDEPGISRSRRGAGFVYRHPAGRALRASERARIRALAIPPAWTQVWICTDPRGHLQATGRDARGRKQYRYHAAFRARREGDKFSRVLAFARALPALRRRVRADLARSGLPRRKVLALLVRLLGRTLARVGHAEYAASNGSFGLSTLRDRHAQRSGDGLRLRFRGKSGQPQCLRVDDARLARLVQRCRALPGAALFQYRDGGGRVRALDAGMVNDYLRAQLGADCSAKDFRTWGATLAALALLCGTAVPERGGERGLRRAEAAVLARVAALLGNTPAVCRSAYVHPAVFALWRGGQLSQDAPRGAARFERWALRRLARAHPASISASRSAAKSAKGPRAQ